MKQFLKHFLTFSAHNSALKWSKNLIEANNIEYGNIEDRNIEFNVN